MPNLRPERTGLPFIVFISAKSGAKHDARVKVAHRLPDFVASVSVRPNVQVMAGKLDARSLALLARWIRLNYEPLIALWEEQIDAEDAVAQIKHIDEADEPQA